MLEPRYVSPEGACTLVADHLKVASAPLIEFYRNFDWRSRPTVEGDPKGWSMPESEAALLYAVARATKPKTILELGTHVGFSASCFLRALDRNARGRLVTVDYEPLLVPNSELTSSYRVFPLTADGVEFSKHLSFPVDMIFEDGNHTAEVTGEFLKNCLPHLKTGGVVFVHDVAHPKFGQGVVEGMRRSLGSNFELIVIDGSSKGLGFWVKP